MAASYPTDKAPHLFKPAELGELKLRNGVVLAPLTRARSTPDRVPTESMAKYYAARGETAGLLIAEATIVSPGGAGWANTPGIYNQDQVAGWKPVVDAVHAKGAPFVLQLWHMGRAAHSSFVEGKQIVAPSALKINGEVFGSDGVHAADGSKQPYEEPRALETQEVKDLVEIYRQAAVNAKEAGFDGVEVHSANGYLLDTFLQSSTNHRSDEYGGPVENRFRLLSEILDAISTVYPSSRVGVRLSPNGVYNDMGSADNVETFTYALQQLSEKRLAYVHVMDGLAFGFHKKCEVFTIEAARKVYGGSIVANCGYDRDSADKVIADGNANAVAIGRPFIANPDLVLRWANDWPLAEAPMSAWYGGGDEGYLFPTYEEQQAKDA